MQPSGFPSRALRQHGGQGSGSSAAPKEPHPSHFNCCVSVEVPGRGADDPVHVFHFDPGAVVPNVAEDELHEAISMILAKLGDARVRLSVETVLMPDEVIPPAQRAPADRSPALALIDMRMSLIRQRFVEHGLPGDRVSIAIL